MMKCQDHGALRIQLHVELCEWLKPINFVKPVWFSCMYICKAVVKALKPLSKVGQPLESTNLQKKF